MTAPLLEAHGLRAGYGALPVLHGIDLAVRASEAVALLGRNGMGKTTTLRAILGLLPLSAGTVRVGGADMTGAPTHAITRAGLALVPEGRGIFPGLTVAEHLRMAARGGGDWPADRIYALFPRLAERRGQDGALLSGGEQQMLTIGRALTTGPRLLILDEATEGLAPLVRAEIWRVLRAIRAAGIAVLVVDKNVRSLMQVTDRTIILEKGRTAFEGPNTALTPELLHRHLGV